MDSRKSTWLLNRPISISQHQGSWISIEDCLKAIDVDIRSIDKQIYDEKKISRYLSYDQIKKMDVFFDFDLLSKNDDIELLDLCHLITFDASYITNLLLVYKDEKKYSPLVRKILIMYYGGVDINWNGIAMNIEAVDALDEKGDIAKSLLGGEIKTILEELKVFSSTTIKILSHFKYFKNPFKIKDKAIIKEILEARENEVKNYIEKTYIGEIEKCVKGVLFDLKNDIELSKIIKHQSTFLHIRDLVTDIEMKFNEVIYKIIFYYPHKTFEEDVLVKIKFGTEDTESDLTTILEIMTIDKALKKIGSQLIENGVIKILFNRILEALDIKKEYKADPENMMLFLLAHLDAKIQQTCRYVYLENKGE